ncbi:MAG: amino acid adenylation domain-containing protein [Candidatus Aminicenantes bacterium]|nr:amino acid adenylation domain-containing protein [Candidatus Aminicenantes bacterium]
MNKIDKRDIEDVMALSPVQEGLLFHYLKAPGGDFYIEQLCLTLTGPVDMDYFKRAWRFVVDTNEMLRSYFQWERLKKPVQVIMKHYEPRFIFHDFSDYPANEALRMLEKVKLVDREEKFDLTGVPSRITLCKMNENRWEMIISNHHILYDGWSNGIILKEFFSVYNEFARRRTPLKPVKHKYREYIAWLRDRDREKLKKARESYLNGFDAGTGLSIKRKKRNNAAGDGHYQVTFSSEAVAGLEIFARTHKITTASLLYGAWGLLLQRYNDCGDVIFGVTVSGRSAPIKNIEDMVGLFINTIPLRIQSQGNEKTVDFLYRLNQEIRDRESDVVLDVQEELFDTIVVIENYPLEKVLLEKGGSGPLTIASYSLEEKTHYDLTVGITLFDGIGVDFSFKEALLDRSSIERLASHFMKITADMVAHPVKELRFLEILAEEEKNTLIYGFNDTRAKYPQDKTIHQLFEEQATRAPDYIAVFGHGRTRTNTDNFSYRQLNEQSNRLAGLLIEKGVLADSIVAIMMERCVEMIIGILGILKAGGAYLPIDPNYPQERIDFMLKDSGTKLLAVANDLEGEKVRRWEGKKVILESVIYDSNHLKGRPRRGLHHSSFIIHHSNHLAYIIYTSGSTGKPKGVAVAHAPVVNRLYWVRQRYELNERDVVLQATSFIFDVSVCELFRWILPGGKLCFLPPGAEKDPGQIIGVIARYGVTTADFAPGMLSLILDRAVAGESYKELSSLRWVFTGVEIVGLNLVKRFNETLHKVNKTRLIDAYGPTESTVDATYFDCSVIDDSYEDTIPIGKPMANVCIYILDRFGGLQPVGVYGELCIAGRGLARGYLNNPELTAKKFRPQITQIDTDFHHSSFDLPRIHHSILYRTGDLARWLSNGNIEFLGRIDHQVKIRGFRVETGEIEGRLLSYKEIDEAVVTSWDSGDGEKFLCAYVVAKEKIDAAMLKNKLAADLPDYMIPTTIVQLDKIPVTASGNIDRRALPEPVITDSGAEYIPPASLLEERLAAVWAEVLGIEKRLIGAGRNFFKLGGHSLKAVRLSAGIQREFDVTIPLEAIFKSPTVRGLAKYIAGQPGGQYLEIEPAEEKEYYALTPAQKRIYFMQRMAPDSTAYHLVSAMEVEGDIDKDRLEQAFVGLINRHESLRTSFHIVADQSVQRIGSTKVFAELFSKSDPPEAIIKSFLRPFDLSCAPLLRVVLLERGDKKHLLLVVMHHIIVDGASVEVLIKEFTVLYEGQNLAATGIRYRDFTEWQVRHRESDLFKRQKEYWLKEFAGEVPVLDLPTDFPRPGVQRFAGKTLEFEIGSEETAALNALALEGGVTLFMALLASYNILLAKLCGREVVVVGAPGEGRPHAALEKVVGMFVNTLALKNCPCGEKPFGEFLREIKDSTLAAFAHQDYPYEELVEAVGAGGNMGRNPLFDTMLALQNKDAPVLEIPGARLTPYDFETGTAKFDLTLRAVETGEKLLLCFEYCTELFKEETVARFCGYFKRVVSGILACPGIRLSDIEILSQEEKEEILVDFNNTAMEYPRDKTIHQLFVEQAARTPDYIALVGADLRVCPNCLTYRQLNEQSGRLAGWLIERGVLADDIVGIMMERSIDLIIGILGILKSGGAYLPIDPEYPRERIDYMLKDSNAKILLTTSDLNSLKGRPRRGLHHSSFIIHHSNHLAYIIYTSGSTGEPKGVLVEHTSVVNYICGQVKFFGINEKDRVLQFSTICFDASVEQVFIALLSGAVLVLVDKETLLEKSACEAFIVSQAITHLHAVPSFLSNIKPGGAVALKRVVCGGDVCPVSLAKWWSRYCDFYNKYGPTETTISSIEMKVEDIDETLPRLPIGKPTANTYIYVLDRWMKYAPRGAAGELYIGGVGVARGYLNRPELTAEKFIDFHHSSFDLPRIHHSKFYRTGDLARWLPGGNIEFLGRIDRQVKIRGFRIELGEIENRLANHPDIKEAVVTVKTDGTGDNYLCAYIISGRQLEIPGLREYLAKNLPGFMIPSYFMPIEKIPLTPNGKVNRGALPQPGLNVGESYTAPRNEIEKKLVRLWAEVLGRYIGIDDHFFQVGGHSLKAAILAAKIHKAFNVPLPLAELFQHPTIRQTGEYIKKAGMEKYVSIDSAEKKEYYRLSYAQERIYTAAQLEKNSLIYNIPAILELSGELERDRLEQVFKRLIEGHESFRTSFGMIEGQVVQRIHDEVPFEIEFGRGAPPWSPFLRPFDLSHAPLLRIGLLKEAEQKHILMIDIHHIISDGTSTGILIRDFLALYKDDRLAHSEPLITYKDFSEWQHGSRYKEILKQQENFWRKQFEGDIPVLNMPCDYSRPLVPDHKGNGFSFELTGSEAAALKKYAAEQEVTLYILLLAIYTVFLAKLSGQEDIVVGSPVAGRNRPELEQVIGMFVNTLELQNFPAGDIPFNWFLGDVKARVLEVFAHQDYPFENLEEILGIKRDAGRNPLFDVMLVLQNTGRPGIEIPGLKIKQLEHETGVSKFDLTLLAVEGGEGLRFSFEYRTTLFKEETIRRFAGYFIKTAAHVLEDPTGKIAKIDIIPSTEKEEILSDFNNTEVEYPRDKTIQQLFEEQAAKTPDHIAIVGAGSQTCPITLTYSVLNEQSECLAEMLIEKGVLADSIVSIMMKRSIELIIGILGILKSGGAYLPIDPEYPQERIDYMLKDSGAKLLVNEKFFGGARGAVFQKSPPVEANLAYVIYTSGSTGKPKGVMIEHRSIVNTLCWRKNYYDFNCRDVVLQLPSFSFDSSVEDIFTPLISGSRLVMIRSQQRFDTGYLKKYIKMVGVTHFLIAPALYKTYLDEIPDSLTGLRSVTIAGENFTEELVKRHFEKLNQVGLYNEYGPAENSVCSTVYEFRPDRTGILIGKPITNVTCFILDKGGLLSPVGVPGELCVSGPGVTRGYLNNPELTADRFNRSYRSYKAYINYKTGDLCKWLPGGNIEFLGRIDHQVKIRGQRIEPGEIESRLAHYEHIKEAVVLLKESTGHLAAYIVAEKEPQLSLLKEYLAAELPAYMIPTTFNLVEKIPLTPNGKVDLKALETLGTELETGVEFVAPRDEIEKKIAGIWMDVLALEKVGVHDNFFDLGGNSLDLVKINTKLKQVFNIDDITLQMFRYPTIRSLARYLNGETEQAAAPLEVVQRNVSAIAVIGMAGRFPGAKNIAEFWENLKNGVESVRFFSQEELETLGVDPGLLQDPHYVKVKGALLENKEQFDAAFFDYTPKEAEIMNPQARILHECAWETLENAGYDPFAYKGSIGFYAGASSSSYWESLVFLSGKAEALGWDASVLLSDKDFIGTRIAYKLNLKGPNFALQTACSTSLAAIHLACRGLLDGECHMALAGGVKVSAKQSAGYLYQEGMIHSPDGHCRAFDAKAKGTVSGEGVGLVLLKPLAAALEDGDYIYAVVKGTAVNNDGIRKIGYTAPGVEGQAEVIRAALHAAQVEPESIGYIEAHGTGTTLGDPVEIEGLKLAFHTTKKKFCAMGSVKTNIGHLDAAAGIAGFIKTVLVLKNKSIPPSLHFETPNPKIDFENSPFYVNTTLKEWKNEQYPLRAGVSSLGIGGTNVHVVLEEWRKNERSREEREEREERKEKLLLLSARTTSALSKMTENLAHYLQENPGADLADVAYTLQTGRRAFQYRCMTACSNTNDAVTALRTKVKTHRLKEDEPQVIFMFTGQGSQYVDMGLDLYQNQPVFRQEMDHCFEILKPLMDYDVKEIIYPSLKNNRSYRTNIIDQTEITQPVLFIFEYALAKLLMKWGITPSAFIGHSIGEYTAACLAGVFSLEDALKIVVWRGRLMQQTPPGAMMSVPLPEKELKPLLEQNQLTLAAVNGTSRCVVSGPAQAIADFENLLKEKEIETRRLHTSHAFHSGLMDPILPRFEEKVKEVRFNAPRIPYISNVSGHWISPAEATDPQYWVKQLRYTVRFADGIDELLKIKTSRPLFIEVGPGKTLSTLVKQPDLAVIDLVRQRREAIPDTLFLQEKIGQLWLHGVTIDWPAFHGDEKRYRVPLPTYPFEGRRYWIEGDPFTRLRKNRDIDDYFYVPTWKRFHLGAADTLPGTPLSPACWLLFTVEGDAAGSGLEEKLRHAGQDVITVTYGTAFQKESARRFTLNPGKNHEDGYDALFAELVRDDRVPDFIVHCWNLMPYEGDEPAGDRIEETLDLGYYSLLNIARAVERKNIAKKIRLAVVTTGLHEETICPLKAAVLGPVKVIPLEYPNIRCRVIDAAQGGRFLDRLINDLSDWSERSDSSDRSDPSDVSSYSGNYRWVRGFDPIKIKKPAPLKPGGVYLITGGLGGMGLALAQYLAKTPRAKLILIGRSPFQAKDKWESQVKALEESGAEVLVLSADVTDENRMREVVDRAVERFGVINGIIHAAGLPDGKVIRLRTRETSEQVLAPKIKGTLVLDKILKTSASLKPDFFIICSSLTSLAPAVGQVGYCAANNFVDAFALSRAAGGAPLTIAIDWDRWQNTGMAVTAEKLHKKLTGEALEGGLTVEEGIEVFGRILGNPFPQVAVSSYDLEMVIKQARVFQAPSEMDMEGVEKMTTGGNEAQRPELETPYDPPRSGSEHFLAESWSALFGYERVGIHDDFFRLGGDSLLAMAAIAKIHKGLGVKVPIAEFFNNPTIEALAVYIDRNKGETVLGAIEPVEKKQYYPVSSAQKRLYILQQMEPAGVAYNQPNMILMEGEPDQERLEVAIKKLIKRHESLRTSFMIIGDEPVQRIHDTKVFGPTFFQKGGFKEFIRPFDLSCAPLLRVGLIKKEETSHILLFDMHHIIADGFSMEIFKRDFMRLYRGEDLPMLKVQYRDFSGQQNSWKQGGGLKKQERYWLREFEGAVSPLDLPGDYPRPAAQSFEGGVVSFTFGSEETKRLKEIAQAEGATLFMILLAVYNVFLAKLAGREDIVVGVPSAGRKYVDLEPIIGMFVNTLALRNYPVMEKVFSTFLREIRERSLAAFENQDYPFEDLVENVVKERDKSRNPLFDVVFALQNLVDPPGTQEEMLDGIETGRAKFDLTLIGIEQEEALHFYFEYCTRLFKKETILRFSSFFRAIISFVMENPAARIGDIEIISPGEKKEILYDFNNTEAEYPRDKTIQQLFAEQAARTPDRIAIMGSTVETLLATSLQKETTHFQITYRQLNEHSDCLAGWLTEKGVLVDSIVGIMTERSIELIIGILGILKSGGAYLPIDPNYPQERIDFMLKDSNAKILLITSDLNSLKGRPRRGLHHSSFIIHHSNLSYLIYTSGSTGKPKGVMVTHRNVVRLVKNSNYAPLTEETRILLASNPVFDVVTFEIWGCLLNGGRLYPAGNQVILDANELGAALKRYLINTLWLTSALFDRLMQQNSAIFSPLKYLLVGGDVLSPRYITEVRHKNKGLRVINGYGPTENTTFSTTFEIDGDYKENIPIGKPIANSTAYIIDKNNHLQPMGVPGELWVGGDGVARGYLNNPELTADRFNRSYRSYKTYINYKTGDLARWLPGGNIEFLGRIDRQVKIRGFRIEPGEIETHLLNHEQIKEAAVVVRTADQGEPYLCAYIVTMNPTRATGTAALREYLAQTLPAYMIPAYFVELEKLPLTSNGKIDRKALPEPVIKPQGSYTAPRNDIEERLTQTWSEILGIKKENIGVDANFFDSGGHSLRATILAARIHKEFNVKIPLTDIFSLPTIRKLAAVIGTKAEDKYSAVEAAEKKEYYPVSSAQKRLFVLHIMDGAHATNYNMPNAFTITGPLDKSRVELAFKRLIQRHESLRTSFTIIGNKPVQRVHDQVEFEIEDFDFATDEHGQTRTFLLNFIRTFDLSRAPLLRMALLKTGEDSHAAIFDMHHIIGDGTAFSILVKEFTALYRDETLPPLKIQYKDFAQWQNRLSSAENIEKQKAYWINRFKDEIPVLNFPTDYPRPAARATKGKMIFAHLPGTLTDKIRKLNLETETTLYIVLLAVYNILLARYTLQEDIIVGSPVVGREHADLHNIIGTFANMLAMRNFPVEHKTFGDFLKEVKENALKAYENQDYQFDELVAAGGIKAAPGRNPLFDTVLNMVNIEQEKNAWQMDDHLDILPYEFEYNAAKYDLLMRAYEDADTIHISLEYATSLFKPGTAENILEHFTAILTQAVQNLEQKIQDITITADFQPVINTSDKDVEFNF